VTGGYPDLDATEELVLAMLDAGADLVEIGVPFSDPIADGPTIQRSSEAALARGATLRKILQGVRRLRSQTEAPLVLMGYANPFYAMQIDGFVKTARDAGVDGIIVPDLPPEEGEELYEAAEASGVDAILLAAPTTGSTRLEMLARRTRGFLYYVSLTGVTSARSELSEGIEGGVAAVRECSDVPVCVGFGISTPEHVGEVGRYADGVVVGSAIVDCIEAASERGDVIQSVSRFIGELKAPLRP
jgi:tryptophan synthase alpha chain